MKLNFRKYSKTLAVYRDFELSYCHGGAKQFFLLTRVPYKNPPKCPDKKGWLTKDVETVQDYSLWGIQNKAQKLGFEVCIPPNFPEYK